MTGSSACLGLEFLGSCTYDPAAPNQSYFTIGQIVSVLALLLAFSQLTKPIHTFRMKAHRARPILLAIIAAIAILFVFVAATLPFIPGKARPLVGYPVFWEILAGILLVGVAAFFISSTTRKPRFRRRNAQAYLDACAAVIAKGNDDDLRELADEIRPGVKQLFAECKSYRGNGGKDEKIEESTRIAFTILDLWSDKTFCKNLVCKAPGTATQIFLEMMNTHQRLRTGYALSNELVHQAFVNRDSILMREDDYSGLGFLKQFRNTVFRNWQFVENYRPLQAWRDYEHDIRGWQVKKYAECLGTALDGYFDAKDYWQYPSALASGLKNLAHIAMQEMTSITHMEQYEVYRSEASRILGEVERGFTKLIDVIKDQEEELPLYDLDDASYDRFDDKSIYGVMAHAIFEYFEQLATVRRHDDALRHFAIGLWLDIFSVPSAQLTVTQNEIGKRLIIHLNKKINENLNPEQRYYPAITRLLISLLGIYQAEEPEQGLAGAFHAAFIHRLKHDFPKLAKADPDFAQHLLPENVTYNSDKGELVQKRRRQRVIVLNLVPPE